MKIPLRSLAVSLCIAAAAVEAAPAICISSRGRFTLRALGLGGLYEAVDRLDTTVTSVLAMLKKSPVRLFT